MMVPELITRRRLTLADYEALPDDQDYEIIDGVLYMSPRARPDHQIVANQFAVILTVHARDRRIGVVVPDADLIVDDRNTYISPDIMYFTAEHFASINRQTQIRTMPDLVIEVLSPSTEDYDRQTKLRTYAALGIPHYWIVDARSQLVFENVLQTNGRYQERVIGPDGIFRPALFPDLEIDLAQTFR